MLFKKISDFKNTKLKSQLTKVYIEDKNEKLSHKFNVSAIHVAMSERKSIQNFKIQDNFLVQ